jgi:hypothetical protein
VDTLVGGALSRRTFMAGTAPATSAPVAGAAVPASARSYVHSPAGYRLSPSRPRPHPPAEPDFGPNVRVFGPETPVEQIQAALDAAAAEQVTAEFGTGRYAFLFKPGSYDVDARLGCYTSVAGLGLRPDDVTINGAVRAEGQDGPGDSGDAPATSWRSAENLAVVPTGGVNRWAVSRAAPLRRVHIRGQLLLSPCRGGLSGDGLSDGGLSRGGLSDGGGFIADSVVSGQLVNATRQQSLARDSSVASWSNGAGNQVFAGVEGAPAQSLHTPPCATPPCTTLPTSPLSREKPFLYVDERDRYRVFLPGLRHDAVGASWADGDTPGSSVPIDRFFVARPSDSVRAVNKALSQGKHLLLTPGVYELSDTIKVKWAGTVVLGLGHATLNPRHGVVPMTVADARGVRIAGLLFDAGPDNSPALLEVGAQRGARTDPRDPASVQDVYFRIGGAGTGRATTALVVNSDNVLLDDIWAWRADHGTGVGRTVGTAETGVVVNGDNVLATGLFVRHFQKNNVVWNGAHGRMITFRNQPPHEAPHDPPDQAAYRHGGVGDNIDGRPDD